MLPSPPDLASDDIEIRIGLPLPMSLAGYLMRAVGTAYPNTVIRNGFNEMVIQVPRSDFYATDADEVEIDAEAISEARMNEPETVAFLTAIRDGLSCTAPAWLTGVLVSMSDAVLAMADAPNYLELAMNAPHGPGEFKWIVCRPGRPSPHELRRAAEAKVAAALALCEDAPDGTVSVAALQAALTQAGT